MKDRLRSLRKALGLTQAAFADKLGIRQQSVGGWEKGENPHPSRVFQICKTFGVSQTWLETGVGEMFVKEDGAEGVDEDAKMRRFILETFERLPEDKQRLILDALDQYIIEDQKRKSKEEKAAGTELKALPIKRPPVNPEERIAASAPLL